MQLLRLARQRFQAELLGLLRHETTGERLRNLAKLFTLLAQRLRPGGHRLFWEAGAGLAEALDQGGVALDETAIALLRELDGELRAGIALERGLYRASPDPALYRRLLELIARSRPVSALLAAIQQRHRLTPEGAAAARPATLDDLGATGAAVAALAAELSGVLARLEAAEGDAFSISRVLREVEPDLRRIGQLLAGLGYREEHEILQPQLERIQSGLVGGADLDDRLTEISAALLDVDQRLASRAVQARGEPDELAESRRHPLQRALAAVYREVQAGLEQVKRAVGDYVSSAADAPLLAGAPDRLHALAGALRVAGLDGAAQVLDECRDYLAAVLAGARPAPDSQAVEVLADALGSVEYFLERLAIDQAPAELLLAGARESLARLAAHRPADAGRAVAQPQRAVGASAPAPPAAGPEPVVAPERAAAVADPEIVEIFTEEAAEVLETIAAQLPLWRAAPASGAPLAELRRAFHTLKGSGRMVGAGLIGDLSWSAEHLLNRVIDGGLEASPAVVEAVERAQQQLPALVQAFARGTAVDEAAVRTLQSAVDAVTRGEAPQWAPTVVETPEELLPAAQAQEPVAEEVLPGVAAPEEWLPEAEALPELVEELVPAAEPALGTLAAQPPAGPGPEGPLSEPAAQAPDAEDRGDLHRGSGASTGDHRGAAAVVARRAGCRGTARGVAPGLPHAERQRADGGGDAGRRSVVVGRAPAQPRDGTRARALARGDRSSGARAAAVARAGTGFRRRRGGGRSRGAGAAGGGGVADAGKRKGAHTGRDAAGAAAESCPRERSAEWLPGAELQESVAEELLPKSRSRRWLPEPGAGVTRRCAGRLPCDLRRGQLAEHLRALRDYLAGAERATVTPLLLRTLHTLRGSSLAAGNEALGLLLDSLDELVRAALEAGRALRAPELGQLQSLCALLDAVLAAGVRDNAQLSADAAALREQVLARVRAEPARAPAGVLDARLARFLEEALEKLFHATTLLEAWRADRDAEASRSTLLEELQAIEQRAEQLNIAGVLQLSRPLLAALRPAARAAGRPPDEFFELARHGLDAFLDVMDHLAAGQLPETPQAIIAQLHEAAAAHAAPEPGVGLVPMPPRAGDEAEEELLRARVGRDVQQAEHELLGVFLEEAEELMAAIDESIEAWRHDRGSRAPFDDLQRHLHTLKGGARMAGLRYLGELSHNFETFLINQAVRFGAFDDAFFARVADYHEQLLRTMDVVKERPVAAPAAPVAEAEAAPAAPVPAEPAVAPVIEAATAAPFTAVPPGAAPRRPAPAAAAQAPVPEAARRSGARIGAAARGPGQPRRRDQHLARSRRGTGQRARTAVRGHAGRDRTAAEPGPAPGHRDRGTGAVSP